jgi:hypothetical protein
MLQSQFTPSPDEALWQAVSTASGEASHGFSVACLLVSFLLSLMVVFFFNAWRR